MESRIFYDLINEQIDNLNKTFKDNTHLKKQDETGKKSFGFLLWFLTTYLPKKELTELEKYITEGNDDHSCDLIFDNTDNYNKPVFYVVQAKWFSQTNINKQIDTKNIKACITDFRTILRGKRRFNNERLNSRYEEFLNHKKNNGKIVFIFVALCKGLDDISEYTEDFDTDLVNFYMFDLNKLKKQYIEIEYKGIRTHNPLEMPYEPKGSIDISVVSDSFIELRKANKDLPHQSYIFLVKPSMIYSIFDKYAFGLFYKNIRNPLMKSDYNTNISETIKNDPLYFWYYNNGITAITDEINSFHEDNDVITVEGLQVINGAQTVYSIYSAYKNANEEQRKKMDNNALITFRLLRSGGKESDFKVTRFTNSQNKILDRDFHANDDIQKLLQEAFFNNTNVWYETRRGEFRKKKKPATVVSNEQLAQCYLAYYLQQPKLAKASSKLLFVSRQEKSNGLYEVIFKEDQIKYDDMLVAYYIFLFIENQRKLLKSKIKETVKSDDQDNYTPEQQELLTYSFVQYSSFEILALYRDLLLFMYNDNPKSINGRVIFDKERKQNKKIISPYYAFIRAFLRGYMIDIQKKDRTLQLSAYFKNKSTYTDIKQAFNLHLSTTKKSEVIHAKTASSI